MLERGVKFYRVSSDSQDEQNQIKAVTKHFDARVMSRVASQSGCMTFRRPRVSGQWKQHEQELAEILDEIKAGKYTVVVIANSSRIDRRDPDLQQLWVIMVRLAGGRIESASEPEFGKSTLLGKIDTVMRQESNYEYAKTISVNVLNAFDRIKDGNGVTGRPIYGFRTKVKSTRGRSCNTSRKPTLCAKRLGDT